MTNSFIFIVFWSLLPFSILLEVQENSPVTCVSDNVACDIHDNDFIESVGAVSSIEECRQLCYDNEDCGFITYYDDGGFPYQEVCQLFTSCLHIHSCTGCTSETRACYQVCGDNVIGGLDDNLLAIVPDVQSEINCKEHCRSTNNCSFYTYFTQDDPNYFACNLLSYLIKPLKPCSTCLTGPLECQEDQSCQIIFDNQDVKSLQLTEPGHHNVTISGSNCQLRVLAVGGGGWSNDGGNMGGGGGSGYIVYQSLNVSNDELVLTVADHRQPSTVSLDGHDIIVAGAGGDYGGAMIGGDGYSGGGALSLQQGMNGGSDGGDGEGEEMCIDCGLTTEGHGSGVNVSSYHLNNFVLSPGVGGVWSEHPGHYFHAGGGGGVLVDGEGPQRDNDNQGEGYGGGGSSRTDSNNALRHEGLPGVILLEIVEN